VAPIVKDSVGLHSQQITTTHTLSSPSSRTMFGIDPQVAELRCPKFEIRVRRISKGLRETIAANILNTLFFFRFVGD